LIQQALDFVRHICLAATSTGKVTFGSFVVTVHWKRGIALVKGMKKSKSGTTPHPRRASHSICRAGVYLYTQVHLGLHVTLSRAHCRERMISPPSLGVSRFVTVRGLVSGSWFLVLLSDGVLPWPFPCVPVDNYTFNLTAIFFSGC
jgi:hypothetical protein